MVYSTYVRQNKQMSRKLGQQLLNLTEKLFVETENL